ncbi:hypothetical protein FNV43_RR09705 [Rhamnella rubrinervis]|uniref:Uncharacterized protein n=1 Tax=Rhamnella rubrinervis TaxID=2594499 RepID=A0A8K0HAG1_9ROSA|nr:hypothetical protein FNV43_RR09705 [Rhamnella rubrinervis]
MATEATSKFQNPDLRLIPQPLDFHPERTVKGHDGLYFWQFMVAVGVQEALTSILKSEGPRGLYCGIGAMGLGAGPTHAMYFLGYEICKKNFSGGNYAAHVVSEVFAIVASDTMFTPIDMVKQRLQLANSPYLGVWDCVKRVLREEGLGAFYASYRTTVLMNAPFTTVHFTMYEAAKRGLMKISPESANNERLVVHATAGALAGALAAFVTTPLDVVKTQLQCQVLMILMMNFVKIKYFDDEFPLAIQGVCGCDRFKSGSIRDVFQVIVKKDGYRGLMREWIPELHRRFVSALHQLGGSQG